MPRILLAGVDPELMQRAAQEFPQTQFFSAATGADALKAMTTESWQAAVVGEQLPDIPAAEVLRRTQELLRLSEWPVAMVHGDKWEELQANLQRMTSAAAGNPAAPAAAAAPAATPETQKHWHALRERFLRLTESRLAELSRAAAAVAAGRISPEQLQTATRAAHNIAGSAAMFGYQKASATAQALDELLGGADRAGIEREFSPLLMRLQSELGTGMPAEAAAAPPPPSQAGVAPPLAPAPPAPPELGATLLLVDDDELIRTAVALVAGEQGFQVWAAESLEQAEQLLGEGRPDIAVVDLNFPGQPGGGFALLEVLQRLQPPVPTVLLTGSGQFELRLRASREGAERYLQKPVAPADLVQTATQVLIAHRQTQPRVVAVDDDPIVLQALSDLLAERHVQTYMCSEPAAFWTLLEQQQPDLILLDVDMPDINGLEVCRVLRADPRYQALPVVFVTGRASIDILAKAFAVGADDFIAKPIIEAEVLARVVPRLHRSRTLNLAAETDLVTGAFTRRKFGDLFSRYERLAQRQRSPLSLAVAAPADPALAEEPALLARLVSLLQNKLRGEDMVGHIDGHLVLAMFGASKTGAAQRVGQMLQEFAEQQAASGRRSTYLAGVAEYPGDGPDLQALIVPAESALRQARSAGVRVLAAGVTGAHESQVDVVLVDDDEVVGTMVLNSLKAHGISARWLRDGQSAHAALIGPQTSLRTRLILLDVNLPGMDGLTLLRALKTAGALHGTRVIMLTARASEAEMLEGLRAGAYDYVAKPFSPQILIQRVQRTLEG